MVLKLSPDLEKALAESARKQGVAPDVLALTALSERFLPPCVPVILQDEWERMVIGLATDCGVSLPDSALTSEGLYD